MNSLVILVVLLLLSQVFWFTVSVVRKRNDVADVAWGLNFILLAWLSLFLFENLILRGFLVTSLVSLWGIRLAWHIGSRHSGKKEDYRYLAWREQWGKWFYLRSFIQIYFLQGLLALIVVLPVIIINLGSDNKIYSIDFLGLIIWVAGFAIESLADRQLAVFLKNPANSGKIMRSGLWKYSRHPNYFGEVTQWWGIWLLAISVPWGFWTFIGPLTISFLIIKVSGIPLLEKKMAENPDFEDYKNKTSMFVPWFSLG